MKHSFSKLPNSLHKTYDVIKPKSATYFIIHTGKKGYKIKWRQQQPLRNIYAISVYTHYCSLVKIFSVKH